MAVDYGGAAGGAMSGAELGSSIMPGWGTAIGAVAGGLMGAFGGKKKKGDTTPTVPAWYSQLGNNMGGWANQYGTAWDPTATYKGQLSAGMTDNEQTSLNQLTNLQSSGGIGDMFNQGKQQISDTLSGKYANAATSPYIQAMQALNKQGLTDSLKQVNAARGGSGNFFTSQTGQQQADLANRSMQNINGTIGSFLQNERQNQLGAAQTAQQFDQYQNMTVPMALINAGQNQGSLARTIQQADLERQYGEWQRQQGSEQQANSQSMSLLGGGNRQFQPATVTTPTQQSNPMTSILQLLNQGGGMFSGMMGNGPNTMNPNGFDLSGAVG